MIRVMEKYLNGQSLTEDEVRRAIRAATIAMKVTPVLCGSAFKNKGFSSFGCCCGLSPFAS